MSYVIKIEDSGKALYFYKLCRRVYQEEVPAFREDIEDAYVFDTMAHAKLMRDRILEGYPHLRKLEIEKLSLRGPDGYVPLENTVKAMLSDDFRKRLWAEYEQLNTRRHQLKMYRKEQCNNGLEPRKLQILTDQINHMQNYMLDILDRCRLLRIDLTEVEKEIE